MKFALSGRRALGLPIIRPRAEEAHLGDVAEFRLALLRRLVALLLLVHHVVEGGL
jgi:hypothetical protein